MSRPHRWTVRAVAALALVGAVPCAFGQQPDLVGAWEWVRKSNGCEERYVFRADGTLSITSGAARTENRYRMAWTPEPNGRYRLTITTVADDGGADCSNSTGDRTGRSSTAYILFSQSRASMILCDSPAGADCIGPLRRTGP